MYFIWLVMSILCMVYYIACINYAGFGSSFVFIWLVASIVFLVIFIIFRAIQVHEVSVPSWTKLLFWGVFAVGAGIFIISEGLIVSQISAKPKENCDYIIVLGAQIKGTKVSKALGERLDTAYDYVMDNPNVQIIVSGGQGKGEEIAEAVAMKDYLVAKGIDSNRILMENQSVNTNENMKFSVDYIADKNAKIGIVSSNFHIYRAVRLAKAQGFTDVSGISSPCNSLLFLNYMVRESIGIVKDAVMGNY